MNPRRAEAIALIARSAAALHAGQAPCAQDCAVLAEAMTAVLEGWADLDEALGLRPGRGESRLQTQLALAKRDDLIRELAARHYADARSMAECARRIELALTKYRESAWRRGDRTERNCPARLGGKPEGLMWEILRCIDSVPRHETIRKILVIKSGGHHQPDAAESTSQRR